MHRRLIAAAMATALSFSVAGSAYAAPFSLFGHSDGTATAATGKMISFSVRNASSATLVLASGSQQITIEPGKTSKLKLAEGAQLTTVNSTATQAAGAVLTTVSKQLSGNTLVVS